MGGYMRLALLPEERVVYEPKLAPQSLFALPGVVAMLAFLMFMLEPMLATPLLLIALMFTVGKLIVYKSTEFALTNLRFIGKYGWLSRRSGEVMLQGWRDHGGKVG